MLEHYSGVFSMFAKKNWFLSLCLLLSLSLYATDNLEQKLEQAQVLYKNAIEQKRVASAEKYLNRSLALYSQIEDSLEGSRDLASLYYNMGNLYYYLSHYPIALAYYYRASKTMPDDPKLVMNINYTLAKLNAGAPYATPAATYKELLQIFGGIGAISIGLFSAYLWLEKRSLYYAAYTAAVIGTLLLCFTAAFHTAAPPEAVVVYPGLLRKGAGDSYASVSETPIFPGLKVRVIGVAKEGKWLKVISPSGEIGYLSYKSLWII